MQRSVDRAEEQRRSASILLVEDEPGIVDVVRRGLVAEGFAVKAELDGTEGDIEVDMLTRQVHRSGEEVRLSNRRKLYRPDDPVPIFTVRSVGYRLGDGA